MSINVISIRVNGEEREFTPGSTILALLQDLGLRPVGAAGLVMASILAAAMANLSAALNSLASATVVDFFGKTQKQTLGMARGATILWAGVLVAIGLVARNWGSVLESGLSIASVTLGVLLGVFLLGVLTRRVGQNAAIAGVIVGLAVILYVKIATAIAFTWWVPIGACSTFLGGCLASAFIDVNLHDATQKP